MTIEHKVCSKCGIDKPINEYHYTGGRYRADCKICHSATVLTNMVNNSLRLDFDPYKIKRFKICSDCGISLPVKAFTRNKYKADGLQSYCKACDCIRGHNRRSKEGRYSLSELMLIFEKQYGLCYYCKTSLGDFWNFLNKKPWHVEHVVPLARGGTNWPSNIQCACAKCNLSKGDKLYLTEWVYVPAIAY